MGQLRFGQRAQADRLGADNDRGPVGRLLQHDPQHGLIVLVGQETGQENDRLAGQQPVQCGGQGLAALRIVGPVHQDGRILAQQFHPGRPAGQGDALADLVIRRQSERRTGPDGQAGVHRLDDAQQAGFHSKAGYPFPERLA